MTEPTTPDAPVDLASPYPQDLACPQCRYSLRGLTSDNCPECGQNLDFILSQEYLIPWTRRDQIGRFRAFWTTVWNVCRRPKILARDLCRPTDYRAAQTFRWICVLIAWLSLYALKSVFYAFPPEALDDALDAFSKRSMPVYAVWYFFVIAALTGLPSYFFHTRRLPVIRQNRAIALSYYFISAPLALAPLIPTLALICLLFAAYTNYEHVALTIFFTSLLVGIGLAAWPPGSFLKHAMALSGHASQSSDYLWAIALGVVGGFVITLVPLIIPPILQLLQAYWLFLRSS